MSRGVGGAPKSSVQRSMLAVALVDPQKKPCNIGVNDWYALVHTLFCL